MFTDRYVRQQVVSGNKNARPSLRRDTRKDSLHPRDTVPPYESTGLGCKSKVSLSQTQQSLPFKLRSEFSHPGPKLRSSSDGLLQRRLTQQHLYSPSSHGMPPVLRNTRAPRPMMYSPHHSPGSHPHWRTTRDVQCRKSYVRQSGRAKLIMSDSSVKPECSVDKKLSSSRLLGQRGDLMVSRDRLNLRSNYSYLYESPSGSDRGSSTVSGQSSLSTGGRWRNMAPTVCIGESLSLDDSTTSSELCSISDSCQESWDYIGQDDDLTDLDSSDEESCDHSAAQSSEPVTLVSREISRTIQVHIPTDSGVADVLSLVEKQSVVDSTSYCDDQLVSEVEQRRQKDFGQQKSIESLVSQSCSGQDLEKSIVTKYRSSLKSFQSSGKTTNEIVVTDHSKTQSDVSSLSCSVSEATPTSCREGSILEQHCLVAVPSSPLTLSLFPNHLPPTIHFPLHDEPYTQFPREVRALLKWKMCSITPNIVKRCITRVGFTKSTKSSTWLGYWGKHMKPESFRNLRDYQKFNHFPGTFEIGRKDRLWRNLSRLQARVGRRELDFVPQTFVLPQDLQLLRKVWDERTRQKWILKPPAAARGIGIRVINRWSQIPKKRPVVVQKYLADPYLINGSKFDLRVYVYVSCYDPLKIYVFKEGLARFATCKYSSSMKHLSNRFMHLTNYSINKHNTEFRPNTDEKVCQGHKWGLLALWRYMREELGVDTNAVWTSITELVIKTIVCSEPAVVSHVKANVKSRYSVHELFGFDVMLDRHLRPWIIEVNISPSLHSQSQLDVNIKGQLVRDLFNISGFTVPSREQLAGEHTTVRHNLTAEERSKHSRFTNKSIQQVERSRVIESLTADDLCVIMQAEDELARCGEFERVFPCPDYTKYRKFFEIERYYNVLLGEWTAKYRMCPNKGITRLRKQANELLRQKTKYK